MGVEPRPVDYGAQGDKGRRVVSLSDGHINDFRASTPLVRLRLLIRLETHSGLPDVYTSFCGAQIAENRLRVRPSGACSRWRLLCVRGVARLLEAMDWARFCTDASLPHSLSAPTYFFFLYRLRGNWSERFRSVRNNWALQYCALRSSRGSRRQFAEEIRMNRCTST